jgi:hypothetical protein
LPLILCAAAGAKEPVRSPDCASVDACIAILREYEIAPPPPPGAYLSSGIDPRPIKKAIERLKSFGDAGVAALLPLLDDPNFNVRNRAGYALSEFDVIEPRRAAALISANRAGAVWLAWPIARTGTDEALDYLWTDFLANPSSSPGSPLPLFGKRSFPRLEVELGRCRTGRDAERCAGLLSLLGEYKPFPDFAVPLLREIAASPTAPEIAKAEAAQQLIWLRDRDGLAIVRQRLEAWISALPEPPVGVGMTTDLHGGGLDDVGASILVDEAATYGAPAAPVGPAMTKLLRRRDLPEAREAAALAVGQIGYAEGVDELLAAAPDFADDWYLAYNAVESLGRLRVERARSLLQNTARTHWYQPVRNNAARALDMLDGGAFSIHAGSGRDDEPPRRDTLGDVLDGLGSEFRFALDAKPPSACAALSASGQTYAQYDITALRWPRHGHDVELELRRPTALQVSEFNRDHPAFGDIQGELTFVAAMGDSVLAGADAGEWGGGVYEIDRSGKLSTLIPENATAAFTTGERLIVVSGLSHLGLSFGSVWVIELHGGRPTITRRIRLPAEATKISLSSGRTLVLSGERGALAVTADGTPVHPREIEACMDGR